MLWCAPRLEDFYVKCGWEPMHSTVTLLGDDIDEAEEHYEEMLFMQFFSDKARIRDPNLKGKVFISGGRHGKSRMIDLTSIHRSLSDR